MDISYITVLLSTATVCSGIVGVPIREIPGSNCTKAKLLEGFEQPLTEYEAVRQSIFPAITYDRLVTLCSSVPDAAAKTEINGAGCDKAKDDDKYLLLEAQGLAQAWIHVCDKPNVYAEYRKCFEARESLTEAVKSCEEDLHDATWFLNYHKPYHADKHRERCQAKKDYLSCVKSAVADDDNCNADAAAWQHDILVALEHPYFEETGCTLGNHLSQGALAIICICAAAGVYVVVLVIVSFVKHAKMKKQGKNKDPSDSKRKKCAIPLQPVKDTAKEEAPSRVQFLGEIEEA